VAVGNQIYSTARYRGFSPYCYVLARWHTESNEVLFRPAVIQNLYEIQASDGKSSCRYWIGHLEWFREHEEKHFFGYNSKTKVWSTLYEPIGKNTYIPLRFIKGRFLYNRETINFGRYSDDVTIAITLPFQSFL